MKVFIEKYADKLAAKIAGAKKVKRTEKAKGDAEPKADPGTIGSKSAVHNALNRLQNAHGAAARKAAQKKMQSARQLLYPLNGMTRLKHGSRNTTATLT